MAKHDNVKDTLAMYLKELRRPAFRASYEELARQAQQESLSFEQGVPLADHHRAIGENRERCQREQPEVRAQEQRAEPVQVDDPREEQHQSDGHARARDPAETIGPSCTGRRAGAERHTGRCRPVRIEVAAAGLVQLTPAA